MNYDSVPNSKSVVNFLLVDFIGLLLSSCGRGKQSELLVQLTWTGLELDNISGARLIFVYWCLERSPKMEYY